MTTKIDAMNAETFIVALKEMGVHIRRSRIDLDGEGVEAVVRYAYGESVYITVIGPTGEFKVRFSDHAESRSGGGFDHATGERHAPADYSIVESHARAEQEYEAALNHVRDECEEARRGE